MSETSSEIIQRVRRMAERMESTLTAQGDGSIAAVRNTTTYLTARIAELARGLAELAEVVGDTLPAPELPTDAVLQARADYNRDNAAKLWPNLIEYKGRWHRPTSVAWDKRTGSGLVPIVFTPYGYADDPEA